MSESRVDGHNHIQIICMLATDACYEFGVYSLDAVIYSWSIHFRLHQNYLSDYLKKGIYGHIGVDK